MKVVDLNVLLYAVDESSAHHSSATTCWTEMLDGDESVALPWIVLSGFMRISTNPRVFPSPFAVDEASLFLDEWLALDVVTVPLEKPHHWRTLRGLLGAAGTAGNLVTDAHIAAIALTHDATVVSFDRDFRRFEGVRIVNPLD